MNKGWDWLINIGQYCLTVVQTESVLRIISLIMSILATVIIAIDKIVRWHKNAKKDGKIDSSEIKEVVDIIESTVEEVVDTINSNIDNNTNK